MALGDFFFYHLKSPFPNLISPSFPPSPSPRLSSFCFPFNTMSSTTPARVSVTNQPQANVELDFKQQPMMSTINEKSFEDSLENDQYHEEDDHDCQHHRRRRHQASSSEHNSCHSHRLRQFFLPAMIALFVLGGIVVWGCVHSSINNWNWGVDELVRRAVTDTTGNGSTFIHNKRQ